MARTIRFHLDENGHRAIADGLRRRGVDVTTTPEVGLLSASDDEQLAHAWPNGRVILTQDRDFLRLHAAGAPHPGITLIGNMAGILIVADHGRWIRRTIWSMT
jgi:predicted nuclease of predicted toxin-antitoxin system